MFLGSTLDPLVEREEEGRAGGWLIFALPPAEIAVHPSEEHATPNTDDGVAGASLYLMCDDLRSTMRSLEAKKASFAPVEEARWGTVTTLALPSGAGRFLYRPKPPKEKTRVMAPLR